MRMLICNDVDRDEFIRRIKLIDINKRTFVADFKLFKKKRSLKANNLYWFWLQCIHDETGNDVDDLHEYFKAKYLPWITRDVFGDEMRRVVSTTSLNTLQFTEYLDHIKADMLQQGIFLPSPGDAGWDAFYAKYGLD